LTLLENSIHFVSAVERPFICDAKGSVDLLKLYNALQTEALRTYIEACRLIRNARGNGRS